jgi:predicted DNA-binding protein YlxM (UPF0122 family)
MISKVMRMEKFVEQTLLYDFYGELLTVHQRRIYEDVVLNDYSLSEVADDLVVREYMITSSAAIRLCRTMRQSCIW